MPKDSSSPNKSILPFGGAAGGGNASACGSGDGGAGHWPCLAAARSTRVKVLRCSAALTFFSTGRAILRDSRAWLGDFEGTRGGDGVRRAVGDGPPSSNPVWPDFCGVNANLAELRPWPNKEARLPVVFKAEVDVEEKKESNSSLKGSEDFG